MTKPVCQYGNDNCEVVSRAVKQGREEFAQRMIEKYPGLWPSVDNQDPLGVVKQRSSEDAALRDLFAAHIVGKIVGRMDEEDFALSKTNVIGADTLCKVVWAWADAMLRTRGGGA